MMYYKLVKVTINILSLVEIIINVVMQHHGLSNSIISNQWAVFTFKFWFVLYYFLSIKQQLSTAFYLKTNSQIK